jgi:hypothetical protein
MVLHLMKKTHLMMLRLVRYGCGRVQEQELEQEQGHVRHLIFDVCDPPVSENYQIITRASMLNNTDRVGQSIKKIQNHSHVAYRAST